MRRPIQVLVVDDSAICRATLRHALESDPEIAVVGEAADGDEAVEQVSALRPSLVTMDLRMPRLGGLEAIEQIMRRQPTPILVITDQPRAEGVDVTFAALSRGALDLLPKAGTWLPESPAARALIARVKQLTRALDRPEALPSGPTARPAPRKFAAIGLGASTGGPNALARILRGLPPGFATPIAVVQHMDALFHKGFVEWLGRQSALRVREAIHGERLVPGEVWVGPSGFDFRLDHDGRVRLEPPVGSAPFVPSIDPLFTSMAENLGRGACGVVLTGMGRDGARGLLAIRQRGGLTAAQDRESSVIYGMPRACAETGAAEVILPLGEIAGFLDYTCLKYQGPLAAQSLPGPTAQNGAVSMMRGKILLVDDSPVMLEAGRISLEEAGYEVVTLDNPLTLAAVLRKERPDLVLCDVNMPAINGDLVAQIVNRCGFAQSPIVLYSDISVQELETKAKQCGARGFIQKTGDDEALIRSIQGFLAQP
jgi:two-component system chemotaxis response regulator CheB